MQTNSVIIVCLLDYAVVREILEPVASKLSDKYVFNLTTGRPDEAKDLSNWASIWKINYVEGGIMALPSLIGTDEALILYSGIPENVFNEFRPILEAISKVSYVGIDPDLAPLLDLALNAGATGCVSGVIQALGKIYYI